MRLVTAFCTLLILGVLIGPASAQKQLKLPSGVVVVVANVAETKADDGKKVIAALLSTANVAGYDKEQLSIISDQFFELYFGPYAEQKDYQAANVGVGEVKTFKDTDMAMYQTADMFRYNRQENGVWQPTHDSKLDEEPGQEAKKVTLTSGAVIHVEFEGTAYVNVLQGEAFVGAFWTDIPISELNRIYPRAREYWLSVKDRIPEAVKVSNVAVYGMPKLGYFHFRDAFVIALTRTAQGGWPELPETWADAERARSGLVQTSYRKDRIKTIWPDH